MDTARDADVHAADRAGTEDHDGVALLDAEQLLGVDRAGERLGGRGLVVPDVVGDPVQPVDLEHLLGHDHELGEAAVVLVADRGLVLADRHPALPALVTLAARHRGDHLGAVADLPVAAVRRVDVGADLDDLAGDLVADGARRGQVLVAVVEDLHVGAAGRAVAHPQLDLVGAAVRLGHVLEPDVLGGVEAQCLHGAVLSGVRARFAGLSVATASSTLAPIRSTKTTSMAQKLCPNAWQRARLCADWRHCGRDAAVTSRRPRGTGGHRPPPRQRPAAGARVHVQKFGTFLSNMIMPNIAAIIAWGLITAFFIPDGWTPNEKIATMVGPSDLSTCCRS